MKIYLHEITDQETELDFNQAEKWVLDAVERVDEDHGLNPAALKSRPVQVHFSLRKVDDVVVVSGSIDTSVRLLCSRCAAPFNLKCNSHFSALFCKDPVMAGVGHLQASGRDKGKPAGQTKGYARHAHDNEATGMDLDITYLSEDCIDLGDILSEQLQLQVPFQPLCKDSCKGMCMNCGADLNAGRCACAKLTSSSPFSVLKDIKIETLKS